MLYAHIILKTDPERKKAAGPTDLPPKFHRTGSTGSYSCGTS